MTGVTRPFMKTYSDNIRNGLILMIACLFVGGYNGSQAIGANPQPRRTTVAGPGFGQPGNDAARLVVCELQIWVILYTSTYMSMASRLQLSDMGAPMRASCHLGGMLYQCCQLPMRNGRPRQ
jgi:hypothetical protein